MAASGIASIRPEPNRAGVFRKELTIRKSGETSGSFQTVCLGVQGNVLAVQKGCGCEMTGSRIVTPGLVVIGERPNLVEHDTPEWANPGVDLDEEGTVERTRACRQKGG